MIPETRRLLVKNCTLLGYYAACSGNSLRTFRDTLSGPETSGNIPEDRSTLLFRRGCLENCCSTSLGVRRRQTAKFRIPVPSQYCTERMNTDVWLTVHRNSVWIRKTNSMSLFVFFISLLIVAQHVSGNHVPIIGS